MTTVEGSDADALREVEQLKSRMLKQSYFVMFRRREMQAVAPTPQVLLAHYRWIIGLEKQGLVLASGPLFDADEGPGVGMTVFRVGSFDEAEALAAGDPFVQAGAVGYEIKRWQLNEGRITVTVDLSDQAVTMA